MGSSINWPHKRKEYSGMNNPRYVTDIVEATENLLSAMKAILGLGDTDFAIISGFDYTAGSPGSYSPGICYMNAG